MRYFIGTAAVTILALLLYFGYQSGMGQTVNLPTDDEQAGLNDQIVINFSHVVAENTPKGLSANKLAELIEQKTNGRIKVVVYPNSMLYSDDEEFRALERGDIQMIAPSFSKVTEMIPEWEVLDLPYLFQNYDEVESVFTGETGAKLLEMLDSVDVQGMALWSSGFKQMTSYQHPILEKKDFKNLRIRTMPSNMLKSQFRLVGAQPIDSTFDKVYTDLEKHKTDAQENTLSNIYSKGFYRVQNYMTISDHGFLGYAVIMNKDFWNRLPKDLRPKVEEAVAEATRWNLQQSKVMNEQDLEKIKNTSSMNIYTLNDQEKKEWAEYFSPLYKNYESQIHPHLIEEIRKEIKESKNTE